MKFRNSRAESQTKENRGTEIMNLNKWSSSPNRLDINPPFPSSLQSEQYQESVSTLAIPIRQQKSQKKLPLLTLIRIHIKGSIRERKTKKRERHQ